MTVHLFGNGPSPAVATYGLRRTVDDGEEQDPEVKKFVQRNFYVDDGLVSKPTAEEFVTLIRNTLATLASANLGLHKVVPNCVSVMKAFPTEDLVKDIRSLDLSQDNLLAQRSLGVFWNLETDAFTYKVSVPDKPFTRCGVLSVVNSIYDPPRLKLCEALLAVEAVDRITKEIDIPIWDTVFYTDSKVVLGYVCNESRRFHIYMANRIQTIRKISSPDKWRYVESSNNLADLSIRGLHPKDLAESSWLRGPEFLRDASEISIPGQEQAFLSPYDPEVRKQCHQSPPPWERRDSRDTHPGPP